MSTSPLGGFIDELKRRRVMRVATLYVVVFWPIIQIVDIASPTMGLADSVMRYLVFAFLGGLPVAIVLAWVFDINRDGIVVTGTTDQSTDAPALGNHQEMIAIGILMAVIAGLFAVQTFIGDVADTNEVVATAKVSTSADPTIAVLPFVSFSPDSGDVAFADGLTEEVLNVLARVKGLRVAARTSAFAYKGVSRNVVDIASELGVGTILEGSVRRNDVDNLVRVTAQLIDGKNGEHYWSRDYTHEYKDIFRIQDEIAADVAEALQVTLLDTGQQQVTARRTSPEAMVMVSAARDEMASRTNESLQDAIRFFRKAIELDPDYAEAHAELAQVYLLLSSYGFAAREDALPPARTALATAMGLNDTSAVVWATKGLLETVEGRVDAARESLKKAIALNSNYAMAFMWYASLLDDPGERLVWYQKALALDPRSPSAGYNVAASLIDQGRDHEAMSVFAAIVEADPYFPGAYELVGRINERRGRLDEAVNQYRKAWGFQPSERYASKLAELYLNMGDAVAAGEWIDRAAAFEIARDDSYIDWLRIQQHIVRGDVGAANLMLAAKVDQGESESIDAQIDAIFAAYYMDAPAAAADAYRIATATVPYINWGEDADSGQIYLLETLLAASHGLALQGETAEAEQLQAWIKRQLAEIKTSGFIPPETYYLESLLAAASGDRNTLLFALQRAMDEGWHQHWRPAIEPVFGPYREDAALKSILGALETRAKLMRDQLQFAASLEDDWGA